jgi:hypothetical protein
MGSIPILAEVDSIKRKHGDLGEVVDSRRTILVHRGKANHHSGNGIGSCHGNEQRKGLDWRWIVVT